MELKPEQDAKFKALCKEIKSDEFGRILIRS